MARCAKNVVAQSVEGDCWSCDESLTDGDGSFLLIPAEGDFVFVCQSCGAVNRLPKWCEIDLPEKMIKKRVVKPSPELSFALKCLLKEGSEE